MSLTSLALYDKTTLEMSRLLTQKYSTSFSLGIKMIHPSCRWAVYAIYGLVRVADEIVDTFHEQNQRKLLASFKKETYESIENGLSTNPILHSFQKAARHYKIDKTLIDPFFESMEMDLETNNHSEKSYGDYIFGSAEVVGLMCLKVFCEGNEEDYQILINPAKSLGAAFQKVNFLRDIKSDFAERGRTYFPEISFHQFTEIEKELIIEDIKKDFNDAYKGIVRLPICCKFGVYTAYKYYLRLLYKIEQESVETIKQSRIRVPDSEKVGLLLKSYLRYKTGAIKHV